MRLTCESHAKWNHNRVEGSSQQQLHAAATASSSSTSSASRHREIVLFPPVLLCTLGRSRSPLLTTRSPSTSLQAKQSRPFVCKHCCGIGPRARHYGVAVKRGRHYGKSGKSLKIGVSCSDEVGVGRGGQGLGDPRGNGQGTGR